MCGSRMRDWSSLRLWTLFNMQPSSVWQGEGGRESKVNKKEGRIEREVGRKGDRVKEESILGSSCLHGGDIDLELPIPAL